ncbi:hypothetical protein AAG747_24915 [Rapidithrix thailandica]|uniref:Uncharacterized protein n=1 Tax=Rapidithrix thailandica TaxID=413964 RepID=A0AAW9SB88_9BACT
MWELNFETTKDKLSAVGALLNRHPYLPIENLRFNRNFVELIMKSAEVKEALQEDGHPLTVEALPRIGASFFEKQNTDYDQDKVNVAHQELDRAFNLVVELLDNSCSNVKDDLYKLQQVTKEKNRTGYNKVFKKNLISFAKIAPLLYDAEGNALSGHLSFDPNLYPPRELENIYCDFFSAHLAPVLIHFANNKGFGTLHHTVSYILNQFIPKVITPAIQRYSSENEIVSKRTISLEQVPPAYTPLRGALAGDCSMVSVPFYGMIKDSYCFWIRKSQDFDEKPSGYVYLITTEVHGKILPYVFTVNGPTLTVEDVQATLHLLAHHFDSKQLLIADLEYNSFWINTLAVRTAYDSLGGVPTEVDLPKGWGKIAALSQSNYYPDYYHEQNARHAKLTEINPTDFWDELYTYEPIVGYTYPENLKGLPVVSRALLAYYSKGMLEEDQVSECIDLLDLQKDDLEATSVLNDAYLHQRLTVDNFKILHSRFKFSLDFLNSFHTEIKAPLIGQLFREMYEAFPEKEWVNIIVKTDNEVSEMLQGMWDENNKFIGWMSRYDTLRDLKASLPDVYLPNYWSELSKMLFLPNGYPDIHVCRKVVKNFRSVGTIENFLEYLLTYPVVMEHISTSDSRWRDFFIRAQHLLEDRERLQIAIRSIYLDHLFEEGRNHDESPWHLADTVDNYELITGKQDDDLRERVVRKYYAKPEDEAFKKDFYNRLYLKEESLS